MLFSLQIQKSLFFSTVFFSTRKMGNPLIYSDTSKRTEFRQPLRRSRNMMEMLLDHGIDSTNHGGMATNDISPDRIGHRNDQMRFLQTTEHMSVFNTYPRHNNTQTDTLTANMGANRRATSNSIALASLLPETSGRDDEERQRLLQSPETDLCHKGDHPRRKLLSIQDDESAMDLQSLRVDDEEDTMLDHRVASMSSNRTQRSRTAGRQDITVDDLEALIIRQLRPRALNMLFTGNANNRSRYFGSDLPQTVHSSGDSADGASSSVEGIMDRLRRQLRHASTLQYQNGEDRVHRRRAMAQETSQSNYMSRLSAMRNYRNDRPSYTASPSTTPLTSLVLPSSSSLPFSRPLGPLETSEAQNRTSAQQSSTSTTSTLNDGALSQLHPFTAILANTLNRWSLLRRGADAAASEPRSSSSSESRVQQIRSTEGMLTQPGGSVQNNVND